MQSNVFLLCTIVLRNFSIRQRELFGEKPDFTKERGCLKWREKGLDPPRIIKNKNSEYRRDSDVIEQFLKECVLIKKGAKEKASHLFEAYKKWCGDNGMSYCNITNFGRKMSEKGFGKETKGYVFYYGLELITNTDLKK